MAKYRELKGIYRWVVRLFSCISIFAAVYQLFYLEWYGFIMVGTAYLYLFLLLYLPLVFLLFPATRKAQHKVPWYDPLAAFLCVILPLYYFSHAEQALHSAWDFNPPTTGVIASTIMLFLVLEAGRRTGGWVFVGIMAFFAFYPLFADRMPGLLGGLSVDFQRLASYHFGSQESIVGLPTSVVANLVMGFMLFAIAMQICQAGNFFMDLSLALAGRLRGAQAKVAIVSSALFGSISGSPVANVIATGTFTIPAMKKAGFAPDYAGGVEACASSGGLFMPPIMGAAAFLMAQFLEISYGEVVKAAIIPALLYYFALYIQIDGYAAVNALSGIPKEIPLPSITRTLRERGHLIIIFFLLIWLLLGLRQEAKAPFYCIPVLFALSMLRKQTRVGLRGFIDFIEKSGAVMAELAALVACVGLIIGSLTLTGIAMSLSREVVELAGGNLVLLLIFSAGVAFLLGIGMTSTAVYIIMAIILAPALVQAGLDKVAVHLFALYWAMISFITPPVALAAFTAAGISGASPMRTGVTAMRLGSVLFVLPFFFVMRPALILHGTPLEILWAVPLALVGTTCWAASMEGYLIGVGRLPMITRVILIFSACLFFAPGFITDLAGIGIFSATVLATVIYLRRGKVMYQQKSRRG